MPKNVCGSTEKTVRVVIGLAIFGVGWYYQSLWGLIGLVPITTAVVGWCPLSYIFGTNTCEVRPSTKA